MIKLPISSYRCAFLAIVATLAASVAAIAAQEPESAAPIAVVSLAGYDQWHENVAMIGELSGSPDLAQGLEAMLKIATANQGLAGLDKTRPWVAALIPVGPLFTAYVCLPVDDLDALLDVVRPLTANISTDRGVYKITLSGGQAVYVARRGDWAVVALDPATIGRAPADPLALAGELPKKYDVAVRLHVARVPQTLRDLILAQVDGVVAEQAVRRPGEDEATHAGRRTAGRLASGMTKTALTEMDEVTVGLVLDRSVRRLTAEVLLTPKEGTSVARRWSEYADRAPDESIAPQLRDAATVNFCSWSSVLSQPARNALQATLDTFRAEALRDVERSARPERSELDRRLALSLFDLADNLPTSERFEGHVGLIPRGDRMAVVAAVGMEPSERRTAQAEQLAAALAECYPGVNVGVETVEDRHGKVRLQRLSRPISEVTQVAEDREMLTRWFGDELELTFGIGTRHLYFAGGYDGRNALKRILAASRAAEGTTAPRPLECSWALTEGLRVIASLTDRSAEDAIVRDTAVLEQSPGKDHIRLSAEPAERGIRISLELEEGVLRLIAPVLGTLGAGY
ncbi:MAG TPA: hypothetical protein DD670_14750 [Planctomycetaceae bacterium]|nr:hypothetical protein [Planctomycetaceae bacterium]